MVVGDEDDRLARGRLDGHGGRRNPGAGLVDDDQPQLSLVSRVLLLGERWRGGEKNEGGNEQALGEVHAEHYSGRARRGD